MESNTRALLVHFLIFNTMSQCIEGNLSTAELQLEVIIKSVNDLHIHNPCSEVTQMFKTAAEIANDLGARYFERQEYDKAETLVRQAIDIHKKYLGGDDCTDSTVNYFKNLYEILMVKDKDGEALLLSVKILIFESSVTHSTH